MLRATLPDRRLPRPRLLAAPAIAACLLAAIVPAGPAAAGIPAGTITSLSAEVPVTGLGSGWRFELYQTDSGPGRLSLGIDKRNAAGTATASERWLLDGGSLTCAPKLASCSLDDEGALGSFGRVDLTFTPTGPRTTSSIGCYGSDVTYGTEHARKGVLTGTLRLVTKTALVGTIRNGSGAHRVTVSIPARVTRSTYQSGVSCPPVPANCVAHADLRVGDFFLLADRRLPKGHGGITLNRELATGVPKVRRQQTVTIDGPGGTLLSLATAQTLAGANLGLGRGAPFLSGSAVYTAGGAPYDDSYGGCAQKVTSGTTALDLTLRLPWRAKATIATDLPGILTRSLAS